MNFCIFTKILFVTFMLFRLTGYVEAQDTSRGCFDIINLLYTYSCIEPVIANFSDTVMADKSDF